jgi:hypothetical protein
MLAWVELFLKKVLEKAEVVVEGEKFVVVAGLHLAVGPELRFGRKRSDRLRLAAVHAEMVVVVEVVDSRSLVHDFVSLATAVVLVEWE